MSISRERLKQFVKLKQKKYRSLYKQCIVEGIRALREIISQDEDGRYIEAVLYTPDFLSDDASEKLLIVVRERGAKVYEISRQELDRLTETVTGQNVIGIIKQWSTSIDTIFNQSSPQLIVAVDNIREPGNLGALIRTCDWFGVDAILLGSGTVDIWNPKVIRSTVGSMVHVPIVENTDLERELPLLRSRGFFLCGTSVHGGSPIDRVIPSIPAVIIFGNEAEGISNTILNIIDDLITIPKYGKAESLNVGVAAGVILSAIRFQSITK